MRSILICMLGILLVLADDTSVKDFAIDNNKFSSYVYKELLIDNKENLLVSPFSVETILALTQSGAVGDTGAEIRAALNLPESQEDTNNLMKSVLPIFHSDLFKLHTANKVYVENLFSIKDSFKTVATDDYEAAFENIEFADSSAAAEEINSWVKKETNDKIENLIDPSTIDGNTRLVLVNALYFEANWSNPFIIQDTIKTAFYTSEDETLDTELMYHDSIKLNYAESVELDAQFIELPFEGSDASMIVVLPNKKEGIALLEKQSASILDKVEYSSKFVRVFLPKFEIESVVDFTSLLMNMGMATAFSSSADFSGIAGNPGDITLGEVHQKSYISVNEGGVVAAAATEVAIPTDVAPPPDVIFNADHPFAFYIQVQDVVLFEGRVLIPQYQD